MSKEQHRKIVLVTGANGYIGSAVCRAFVRSGWRVFGLVRNPHAAESLQANEVIPLVGSLPSEDDPEPSPAQDVAQTYPFLDEFMSSTHTVDVLVGCSEQWPDYASHYHQVVRLFNSVAAISNAHGIKPLVLWSSGCKDYGFGDLEGISNLSPHTEASPLNPGNSLAQRTKYSIEILSYSESFDAAVLRPTTVYGYSSSFYGGAFELGARLASESHRSDTSTIKLNLEPRSIMHGLHVDDCGEAYVALAQHHDRSAITEQCFNVSGHAYETTKTVVEALRREYGISQKIEFTGEDTSTPEDLGRLFGFSQWVDSSKLRGLTGWSDKRALFSKDIGTYRRAYEAAKTRGSDNVAKVQGFQWSFR